MRVMPVLRAAGLPRSNHPDVIHVTPDDTSIKIEQIRAVQRRLSYKPYENQRTTVLIESCELLSPPAANALLKTLEEPQTNALLLLLTSKKEALPLTIVSRCQLVPFRPLSPPHLRTIFERQGVDPATAALAASLTEGQLDRLNGVDLSQLLTMRQSAYNVLQDILRAQGLSSFLQARKLASKRDQCDELVPVACLTLSGSHDTHCRSQHAFVQPGFTRRVDDLYAPLTARTSAGDV